jgi:hypothetical protein
LNAVTLLVSVLVAIALLVRIGHSPGLLAVVWAVLAIELFGVGCYAVSTVRARRSLA